MIDIDYETLAVEVESGEFRRKLEQELRDGFEQMVRNGVMLPPASFYATKIAEIVARGADEPIIPSLSFEIYQEIHVACEAACKSAAGEDGVPV